ncbi:TPM domain-containing protein [Enterococcus hermanniensis]|uniref:TPM domain-containing protein n=1 Tax=Enterococcus hermanniensis TaxID=249189 RepID=A0A1L8TS02_9ENTE|nr:TPM domain-containing protein [Enterococcus hermanniensis]OJG46922.1 hypothetical protein RV04_GL000169 [Enterococcus hermanniensis]
MKRFLFLCTLLFLIFIGKDVQADTIFVDDQAHVLSQTTKDKISSYNQNYQQLDLHPQLVVITLPNLPSDDTLENYANETFNRLGIGDKKYDSGILYVIAVNDRKQRIEVGYGLEAIIPDGLAYQLMDDQTKEFFQAKNYDAGVAHTVSNIDQVLTGQLKIDDFSENHLSLEQIRVFVRGHLVEFLIFFSILARFFWLPLRKISIYLKARKDYAKEIRKLLAENGQSVFLRYSWTLIGSQKPTVLAAKTEIKQRYQYLFRSQKPCFFDFAFAFGDLSLSDLLSYDESSIRSYSVYTHYSQLWEYRSSNNDHSGGGFGGSGGSSGSGGGGDSFGGGSSGGGGANSGW